MGFLSEKITRYAFALVLVFFSCILSAKTVTLRWDKVDDASFYEVEILKDGKAIHTKNVPAKRRKLKKELPPGEYAFHVRAIDEEEVKGEWAAMKKFTVPEDPPPVVPERVPSAILTTSVEEKPNRFLLDLRAMPSSYAYAMTNSLTSFTASSKMFVTSFGLGAAVLLGRWTPKIDFSDSVLSLNYQRHHLLNYGTSIEYDAVLSENFSFLPRIGVGVEDTLESVGSVTTGGYTLTKLSYVASRIGVGLRFRLSPKFSLLTSAEARPPLSFAGVVGDRSFGVMDNLLNFTAGVEGTYLLTPNFATRLGATYQRNRFRYKNGGPDFDEIQSVRYVVGIALGVGF